MFDKRQDLRWNFAALFLHKRTLDKVKLIYTAEELTQYCGTTIITDPDDQSEENRMIFARDFDPDMLDYKMFG